jgi:hypothetical protein
MGLQQFVSDYWGVLGDIKTSIVTKHHSVILSHLRAITRKTYKDTLLYNAC